MLCWHEDSEVYSGNKRRLYIALLTVLDCLMLMPMVYLSCHESTITSAVIVVQQGFPLRVLKGIFQYTHHGVNVKV